MSDIKLMASEISSQYLSSGIAPTDSLVKIASARGLTPHQVEVLAGEANRVIHTAKYASAEEKYHAADFPLADSKAAVRALQGSSEKVASEVSSQFADPVLPAFDMFNAFGVTEEAMDKTASERAELRKTAQQVSLLAQKQEDAAYMAKVACANAENDFIKTARAMVLEGLDQQDRMRKMATVAQAARCYKDCELTSKALAKVAYSIGAEGFLPKDKTEELVKHFLEKKADVSAPQGLVSEFLPAKVVNGTHPLIVTLKTFLDADERERAEAHRHNVIDDKARIYAQKIRGL
jgi:hypothetical protein